MYRFIYLTKYLLLYFISHFSYQLMFNNCRQYNEEGSLIYEDANTLERVLMDKVKELGPLPDTPKPTKSSASTPTRNVGYVICLNMQDVLKYCFGIG